MVTWLGELLFIFKMLPDIGFLRCMGLGGEGPTIQFFFLGKKKLQIKNSVVSYEQFCFFGNAPWTVGPTEYES